MSLAEGVQKDGWIWVGSEGGHAVTGLVTCFQEERGGGGWRCGPDI